MGFLDRLFGTQEPQRRPAMSAESGSRGDDARALERYRYLLRTAPPETIEQVHAEAFARLTDSQRALIYEDLSRGAGTGERPLSSEPSTLARAATRAELRAPGSLERSLSGGTAGLTPGGPSFGSLLASSMLGTVAGYVVGSALMSAFLPWDAAYDTADSGDAGATDSADAAGSVDAAGGFDAIEFGGGEFGGDFGF
ncbi:hypothetical protein [Protaetiibacter larvae]|uniref:hypothetical protein n=1 Tax=Protaetiibacter larvae TaxID=2592654 RepID=UPI001AEF3C2F|nr:hypothetical protein [Protaetiibacter larvae]